MHQQSAQTDKRICPTTLYSTIKNPMKDTVLFVKREF